MKYFCNKNFLVFSLKNLFYAICAFFIQSTLAMDSGEFNNSVNNQNLDEKHKRYTQKSSVYYEEFLSEIKNIKNQLTISDND